MRASERLDGATKGHSPVGIGITETWWKGWEGVGGFAGCAREASKFSIGGMFKMHSILCQAKLAYLD